MTEKKDFPVFRVGIVTLSDKGYQGEREDKSGPKIKELLPAEQYEVVSMRLLPDERAMIEEELIPACRSGAVRSCPHDRRHGIFHAGCDTGGNSGGIRPCGTWHRGGDPRGQHGDHKTGDAEPGSECNPSSDADYQSAGKPEGGGRESWICT